MSVYEKIYALAVEIGRPVDFVLAVSFAGAFFLGILWSDFSRFLADVIVRAIRRFKKG